MSSNTTFRPTPPIAPVRPSWAQRLGGGLLLGVLALAVSSCGSVKIQSQRSPGISGLGAVHKMMVVAVDERPDMCIQFENQFVKQWLVPQVECTASHGRFTRADFMGDREAVRRKLAAAGAEVVLVVRATDRATGVQGPGTVAAVTGVTSWSEVGEARYQLFTSGGEITTVQTVTGRLFRVSDGTLVWSSAAQVTMGDQYNLDTLMQELAGKIAGQLRRDQVFN